jgi:hypothetical protein
MLHGCILIINSNMPQSPKFLMLCLLMTVASSLYAQKALPSRPSVPQDLHALVKEATDHAVKEEEQQTAFYRFRMRRETKSYKLDRELVEIKQGYVARTLLWEDRELTPQERADDDAKLSQLISDQEEQKRIFNRQQEDAAKIMRLVKALPDGVLYSFDGYETINNRDTYRLKFIPNPKFSPTSREALVFKAAAGFLWIDCKAHTVVRLEGSLIRDINIGWGFLGHINKGGKVELEQNEVSSGHWRITKLITEATGNAFLFKSISIWQHQTATDFVLVPDNLTLQQAVELVTAKITVHESK